MSEITTSSLTVLLLNPKEKVQDIILAGMNQRASCSPLFANLTTDDTAMEALVSNLVGLYSKYKALPPLVLKSDVEVAIHKLVAAYNGNAPEIQGIARKAATDAGDVNVGISLVKNVGYMLKNPRSATENTFDVKQDGVGAVLITTKAVASSATYIRQYGICANKNVVPTDDALQELLISRENDIRVINLKSVACYAFREASILPISRKPDSVISNVEKKATPTVATKHRRTFSATDITHYIFGPWKWVVVL